MWNTIRTMRIVTAGFKGALSGPIIAAMFCLAVAVLPTVFVSLANRGTIDLDAFFLRSKTASSQAAPVSIEGLPEERMAVRKALDDLAWPALSPGLRIVVIPSENLEAGAIGTYDFQENVIQVSQDVVFDSDDRGLLHVLAHEIGHQVDGQYLDEAGRAEFMRLRGRDPQESWTDAEVAWEDSPREDFAEVFAALAAPSSSVMIQTNGGGVKDLEPMLALMRRFDQNTVGAMVPRHEITLLPLVSALAHDYSGQPFAVFLGLGIVVMSSAIGAVHSMRAMARLVVKHARVHRRRLRLHNGWLQYVGV